MNRITVQSGYDLPFDAYGRAPKKRRGGGGSEKQKSKMRSCAKKWKSSGRSGSYRSFMSKCLRG